MTASNGPQDDGAKNMFAGAVFSNCQFTFALDTHSFKTGKHSNLFQRKKFKRILPLSDRDDLFEVLFQSRFVKIIRYCFQ